MAKYCERCGSQLKRGRCPVCDIDIYDNQTERRFNYNKHDILWFIVLALIITSSALCSKSSPFYNDIDFFVWQNFSTRIETSNVSKKTYKNVTYPLEKTGETVQFTLSAGNYVVGQDIPEGTYTVTNLSGFGAIIVNDSINRINILESLTTATQESGHFNSYIEDIRLYQGADVTICTNNMSLKSTNAQSGKMIPLEKNPLTAEYIIEEPTMIGETIPAGMYDIIAIEGSGKIQSDHYFLNINEQMSADPEERYTVNRYNNVSLQNYEKIDIEAGLKVKLVPSLYTREES